MHYEAYRAGGVMDRLSIPENPSVTTLYLARHGQSEWNNQSLVTGQLNPGLSPKGLQQSEALAQCLQDERLAAIYTSVLQRTIDTAQPTADAQQLSITSLPSLNEMNLGVLQGRYRDERDPEAQAMWAQVHADMWGYQVPGGESYAGLTHRVGQTLHEILHRHRGQRILIVGHRNTNRVLMGELMKWPLERWPELRLRNKFLYRISIGAQTEIATFALSGSKTGVCHDSFIM
jgi:broad specificity phosphatase PhoE